MENLTTMPDLQHKLKFVCVKQPDKVYALSHCSSLVLEFISTL